MFIGCESLKLLDLSLFSERNILDIISTLLNYQGSPKNLKIINKYIKAIKASK